MTLLDSFRRDASEIAARLDRLPISLRHWRLFVIVGLGLIVDTVDIYVTSGISGALRAQGEATMAQVSQLAMATALGLGLGAFGGGLLGDWLGRRTMMLWCSLIVAIGALGCSMAADADQLILWRLVTTLGLGVENVLAYGMVIEFLPPKTRGRWMAWLAVAATCAAPLTLLAGIYILPAPGGWRTLMFIVFALSALTFLLRFGLPESARWLATRGRIEQARAIVASFERSAGRAHEPAINVVAPPVSAPATWSAETFKRFMLAALINIGLICATLGFVSWLPTFFAEEGRDLPSALVSSAVITAGAPIGALLGMIFTDMFERKWVTASVAAIAATCGVAYAFAPDQLLPAAGFATVVSIYAYGAIAVTGYMPELFSTHVRMRAIGGALTAGRIVAFGLPAAMLAIFASYGQSGVISLIAGVLLTVAIAVALFGVRTRGRSLDDI